jgi:tight adherence protein B
MRSVSMKKLAAGAILALLVALGLATAAPAADGTLTIRRIDTTDFPNVKVVAMTTPASAGADVAVKENGKDVVAQTAKYAAPRGIVLVVDTSGSMNQEGRITAVRDAIRTFVGQLGPDDQVGIVGFGNEAEVVQGLTTDRGKLSTSVDRLSPNQETAMWDGVSTGLQLLAQSPVDLQPNLVVITDGHDTVSSAEFATTKANVLSANASVFAVGIQGTELDPAPLQDLASSTGGTLETGAPDALGTLLNNARVVVRDSQYEVSYRSALSDPSSIDLELKVGDLSAKAQSVGIGTVTEGVSARPEVVASKTPGLFKGATAKFIVALLVLAAAGLLAYALILLAVRDASALDIALQPYAADAAPVDEGGVGDVRMAETALVKRAVEMTGRIAEERGLLQWVERQLEQGDLPLRAAEAIFFWLSSIIVFTLLGLFATRTFFGGLVLFVLAALTPALVLSGLSNRRRRQFTSQLPDTLQLLSGSLRAGYSLLQGVEAVSQEVDDPMGKELRRVLAEARLGRPLEDSLADTAERMGSPDFEWAVMAIRIQREVGGNLAELLQTVGETMIARERLRREVRALTAEGRISALILGILPVALGFLMYGVNPDYIKTLFENTSGHIMLAGAGLLALVGFYWMKKTIEIEV